MKRFSLALAALCFGSVGAVAAAPPCSQIRIIVPFTAGGATDQTARIVADPLSRTLNKPVVVENRPGATGNIGTAHVAKSTADGCTLVVNVAAILTYQWVFPNLGYDPVKDLVAIGGIGRTPSLIVAPVSSPVKDLKELVALSKESREGLIYAVAGRGLMPHLGAEALARATGAKFVAAFYKGAPDFMADLMTNRVAFGTTAAANSMPLVRQGKLKAIAAMQEKRSPLAPDVPTTADHGMTRLDASSHFILYAPAGTPAKTVELLSTELQKIVNDPATVKRLNTAGFDPSPIGAKEAAAIVAGIGRDWEPIVRALNLMPK